MWVKTVSLLDFWRGAECSLIPNVSSCLRLCYLVLDRWIKVIGALDLSLPNMPTPHSICERMLFSVCPANPEAGLVKAKGFIRELETLPASTTP